MKISTKLLAAAVFAMIGGVAFADYQFRDGLGNLQTLRAGNCGGLVCWYFAPIDQFGVPIGTSGNPLFTSSTQTSSFSSGAYAGNTIGTSSSAVANSGQHLYEIFNASQTATVACAFGTTPVINGAGSITIPPGWMKSWPGGLTLDSDANCIASAVSTPVTVAAR